MSMVFIQSVIHETNFRPRWTAVDFDTARTGVQGVQDAQQAISLLHEGYSILDNRSWDITFEYTL
jgi:hypothetical protein